MVLCTMWLHEFVTKEHLNGGMGNVGPPIISRIYQFVKNRNLGFHQMRKIAYIPFPFAHAELVAIFVNIICIFIPMLCFVSSITLAGIINFFTVMCFTGLHEVGKELENPFKNAPNDIPLNNFQAQFNEALITVFSGFHPYSWWEINIAADISNNNDKNDTHYIESHVIKKQCGFESDFSEIVGLKV